MGKFRGGLSLVLFGAALAGIAAIGARYRQAIQAARRRLASLDSQMLATACGPVEVKQVGAGYPLLTIHGAMGGFDQGLWLAQAFRLSQYRVISVSRFGYLRSPLPPGADLNRQADAFAALLDTLGIQQAAVFAISAGTTAAIRFAARHPERIAALVLLGPDAPGPMQMALPPRWVFDSLLRSDFIYWALITLFGKWVQDAIGLVPKGYSLTPQQAARVKMIQLGDLPVSRRIDGLIFETYTCADEYQRFVTPASPYPLSQIETPALVINANDDPISIPENVRALASQLPQARLLVVPAGGHFLFGHDQAVAAEIGQFLREQTGQPQAGGSRP